MVADFGQTLPGVACLIYIKPSIPLELNIRQRILSDLATLDTETEEDLLTTRELIQSKARLADEERSVPNGDSVEMDVEPRSFMSEARAHCNIAFGELVASIPEEHIFNYIDTLIPVLTDFFSRRATQWALPDQLVFSTVSALLRICGAPPEHADRAVTSIINFVTDIVQNLKDSGSIDVLTHLIPSVHGLYRAITSTLYPWPASQWRLLSESLQSLVATPILERINRLLLDIHQEADATSIAFCHTFISRYIAFGRPLSAYLIICCVMEMQWTVLAQALASTPLVHKGQVREAAAANKVWVNLMKRPAKDLGLENDEETKGGLTNVILPAKPTSPRFDRPPPLCLGMLPPFKVPPRSMTVGSYLPTPAEDPVVGYMSVRLVDLLQTDPTIDREWWPLNGCKSGKIRLSCERKPLQMAGALSGADQYVPPIGVVRLWLQKATDVK
ncbi:hypothetical protein EDB19DRAFT_1963643 [Suillus lakei]|nr:hypothetical protein EDB19DRAFT_1963643 [Suillus lakei]